MEALSDGGVKMGLSRDLATHLAVQTTLGTAKMALNSNDHLATLREAVTSPAGKIKCDALKQREMIQQEV
jgi:pyrroline-5-carboxylate reductase